MTLIELPPLLPTQPTVVHRPGLRTVVGRVSLSLLIACLIPAVVFFTCFEAFGVWPAILAAMTWSYGTIAWRKLTGRRTSGLLALTAVVMTGRTVVALVAHSTFLYFLQPIITDGVVSATFLLSLMTARPMVARLAGDFYPMDAELHLRPRIRRLLRNLTAMWGVICLTKAVMMLWVLQTQSLNTFVLVKSISMPAANLLAVVLTIGAAALVARKEGLIGPQRLVAAA